MKKSNPKKAPKQDEQQHQQQAEASQPAFRFAQMQTAPRESPLIPTQPSFARKPPPVASIETNVINKNDFFAAAAASASATAQQQQQQGGGFAVKSDFDASSLSSNWIPTTLRAVPAFYPLEKSSRLVEDEAPSDIASRLSQCLRTLSVQAVYDNDTASLLTGENVEMHLSLWKTPAGSSSTGVVVELQRRKGDSIAFHRYSRSILDAAVGDHIPLTVDNVDDYNVLYSKKVQRLLSMEMGKNQDMQEHENAIIAIEISHGLLMKDRMDARQLGLESLCLLTDPRKTGYITAVLTSHVVLLGSTQGVVIPGVADQQDVIVDEGPFQEIRDTILGLVQFSRIGDDEHDDDMADQTPEAEHMTVLHNLALAVLANALDVIENPDRYDDGEPEDTKPRARLRTSSSAEVASEFLQQSEGLNDKEMLSTLISELGKAQHKPHDATLSAKCLGSLLRASDEAKRRAKELDAKTVVSAALDVGVRTHLKLEAECKKVVSALEQQASTEGERRQRGDNNNVGDDDDGADAE